MRGIAAAIAFLTRLPVGRGGLADEEALVCSVPYFPLVGAMVGLIVAGMDCVAIRAFTPTVASALDLCAFFLLTGGMHFDGLVDAADGLLSGRPRERALEIMRDSRVGAMGVGAGLLLVLVKLSLLAAVPGPVRLRTLVLAPALGRWAMLPAMASFPYARDAPGLGGTFARKAGGRALAIATTLTAAACVALGGGRGCGAFLGCAVTSLCLGWRASSALGGLTGDVYGALAEVGEAVALAFFAAGF